MAKTLGPCRQALADAGLTPADIDQVVLVGGSTRVPLVRRRVQELFGKTPHSQLNPDEVVAMGAAVQAQILAGGITDMLLLDVTPLSLGIETLGGIVIVLIARNTTIPTSAREMFTTSVDGQTVVDCTWCRASASWPRTTARWPASSCAGSTRCRPACPKIEMTFLIDANGILQVQAKEQRTGKAASIEVKPTYGLTDVEVERMVEDSFTYAEADVETRHAHRGTQRGRHRPHPRRAGPGPGGATGRGRRARSRSTPRWRHCGRPGPARTATPSASGPPS